MVVPDVLCYPFDYKSHDVLNVPMNFFRGWCSKRETVPGLYCYGLLIQGVGPFEIKRNKEIYVTGKF